MIPMFKKQWWILTFKDSPASPPDQLVPGARIHYKWNWWSARWKPILEIKNFDEIYLNENRLNEPTFDKSDVDILTEQVEKLSDDLEQTNQDLFHAQHELCILRGWYNDFEDLAELMRQKGIWDEQDIDDENPMNTYKKGLERFFEEHEIKKMERNQNEKQNN